MDSVHLASIRFSQSDVSGREKQLKNRLDVDAFTCADVVQFGDRFVTLNNRRVLRAKHARESQEGGGLQSVQCRVHQPTDPIDSRTALDEYGLSVGWISHSDAFSGTVFPLTWGARRFP